MFMTALELVQEAAIRVGMVQPVSIEGVYSPDPSKKDPYAMILLGALNESMRQILVKNLFDPFLVMKEEETIADSPLPQTNTFSYDLSECPDFGGLLTSYIIVSTQKIDQEYNYTYHNEYYREVDLDVFTRYWRPENEEDIDHTKGYILPEKNIFRNMNGKINFISNRLSSLENSPYTLSFTYRSVFGVKGRDGDLKNSFKLNDDTTKLDDELLIIATVMNYKSMMGLDFQIDMQKYTEYIKALEANKQNNNLIHDLTLNPIGGDIDDAVI
jgi:hypothetical protein